MLMKDIPQERKCNWPDQDDWWLKTRNSGLSFHLFLGFTSSVFCTLGDWLQNLRTSIQYYVLYHLVQYNLKAAIKQLSQTSRDLQSRREENLLSVIVTRTKSIRTSKPRLPMVRKDWSLNAYTDHDSTDLKTFSEYTAMADSTAKSGQFCTKILQSLWTWCWSSRARAPCILKKQSLLSPTSKIALKQRLPYWWIVIIYAIYRYCKTDPVPAPIQWHSGPHAHCVRVQVSSRLR